MKKGLLLIISCAALLATISCNSGSNKNNAIKTDSISIVTGENAFNQNCSGCHNFTQDGIGPQLSGLTEKVPAEWISNFIRDPKKNIDGGDERSRMLFDKFHTVMPSFSHLKEDTLDDIIAYLNTIKKPLGKPDYDTTFLKDPIGPKIARSTLVLNLNQFAQIPFSSEKQPRTRITKLDFRAGSDDLYVLDLRGKLYILREGKPQVFMDMKSLREHFIDEPGLATGFGSFAFHPEFDRNGLLYTSHTEPKGTAKADFAYADSIPVQMQWVVTEWKTSSPDSIPFKGESRELFRIDMVTGIHGMQELTFNRVAKPGSKDYGMLYIGIGDGGSVENNYPFLVHNKSLPWGTIFRIDPSGRNSNNGKYGIPADNPFANQAGALGEIYAYGFRNPHRITWARDGKMLAINIGQANIESLNVILPGHDYGWPIREGNFSINPDGNINKPHPLPSDDKRFNITYPVAQYDHDEGKAITGGFEYLGKIPALHGKYIFGDINNGRLFYVELKDLKIGKQAPIYECQPATNGDTTSILKLCGTDRADMRLGRDSKGEMYVFTKPDGKIYKITGVAKK
jgi:mono/diheme cytochrome c family protein